VWCAQDQVHAGAELPKHAKKTHTTKVVIETTTFRFHRRRRTL